MNPETILPWSEPQTVKLYKGTRTFRRAKATPELLAQWRSDPAPLKAAGIWLGAFHSNGDYDFFWFLNGSAPEKGRITGKPERIESSRPTILDAPGASDPSSSSKPLKVAGGAPKANPPKVGASYSEEDEKFVLKALSKRKTVVTVNERQFAALCARNEKSIRIFTWKVGKTNAQWIVTFSFLDPKLL